MKKRFLAVLFATMLSFAMYGAANATVLTFEDEGNLGVTLAGSMTWNNIGGGHLYMEMFNDDDYISFAQPTLVNSFQINAMPWENYGGGNVGFVDIAAFNASNALLWSTTVDLTNYTDWNTWLNVTVNTENVSSMTFYSPANTHNNGFWPSIDNMSINNPVPEPASILLLGSGLLGLLGYKKKRS